MIKALLSILQFVMKLETNFSRNHCKNMVGLMEKLNTLMWTFVNRGLYWWRWYQYGWYRTNTEPFLGSSR